ncbi:MULTISPECIES: alpha/beta hydrolase [unclassified Spirosoma]|uniref:alpha/beta hydrolase n=1 Tax=unclassified Spirosoma TaxID=2621999 RepID=UPI00096584CE|nr:MULTISPECIES: alpha/beta hydrolase [unclassified Spirosoma]MBN8826710.1 alpha/beta hydrolase [Spirosoma sp.]OJW73802.1 MAG: endo-1,4-beta-xylanase [Spirosoma sp. 48-14]
MIKKLLLSGYCCLVALISVAQHEISLYTGPIPNSKQSDVKEIKRPDQSVSNVVQPTLTVFLPPKKKATGTAVIVCPGGGYETLVMKREGFDMAEAFTKLGVAAFVMKYRLPNAKTMIDPAIGPLQDAQQALKIIRQRAAEWGVDPKRIGIMGFSAGGHLAATAGTHFQKPVIDNPEAINLRPDFMILIYPVISLSADIGSAKNRKNLLGESPKPEQIQLYSNELHVDKATPPTFLTHAGDDSKVPVKNSLVFYEALQQNGVPADLHVYQKGEHGFGKTPMFDEWFGRIHQWMKDASLLTP